MPIPQSYRSRKECGHPSIQIEKDCSLCSLGILRQQHNQRLIEDDRNESPHYCVGGAGPDDLTDVKLIIISDYPGPYEIKYNQPMYDRTKEVGYKEYKRGILQSINAGALLRKTIQEYLGLDTYTGVYITNAIKCYPAKNTVLESDHVKPCAKQWLAYELNKLDLYCPTAPILVCGTNAFKGLKAVYPLYKDTFEDIKSLNSLRRRFIQLDQHPCTGTFNPALIARSLPTIDEKVKTVKDILKIVQNGPLNPPLPLSPLHKFLGDILQLQEYL